MRRIYAQGDLDGACFLYSIANAYVALRHDAPAFASVCRAFGQVDHPGDFLNGQVGTTGSYDKNYALLERNIRRMLALLGPAPDAVPDAPPFYVTRVPGPFRAALLEQLIDASSVVLVRYKGSSKYSTDMDHWVCAVEYDRQRQAAHVACSVRWQKSCDGQARGYGELFHERYGRWSNDILDQEHAHAIVEEEVFRIATEP
jgi:hypothetical protein